MTDRSVRIDPQAIPPEIDRWNWGAFLLNWIWGVGNNTFIALLMFVPLVNLVMPFVLGAKGSRWAWRNGRWDSVAHFKRVQRLWAIWGVIVWLASIVIIGGISGSVFWFFGHSEVYQLGASQLKASTEATSALGASITTGYPIGKISVDGTGGQAIPSFSATGTKATGQVFLEATKRDGAWSLKKLVLKVDGQDGVIDLINQSRVEIEDFRQAAGRALPAFS